MLKSSSSSLNESGRRNGTNGENLRKRDHPVKDRLVLLGQEDALDILDKSATSLLHSRFRSWGKQGVFGAGVWLRIDMHLASPEVSS